MIYHLAELLKPTYSWFNLFRYVTVRSILALFCALIISLLTGQYFLRWASTWSRSKVRDLTPENHQKKNDTPTMGGLFIAFVFITSTLLWANWEQPVVWLFLVCFCGFAAIGFYDDWAKIRRHRGMSAGAKFTAQSVVAFCTMLMWYCWVNQDRFLCIPFIKWYMPELGIWIIPWGMFVIVATSNSVNLTDGLDGLATGPLICSYLTYSCIAYVAGNFLFSSYLYIPHAHSSELTVLGTSMVGALFGFLWYNTHPAEIFMGDVGALALGAGLGFMAIATRQELLLPLCGGIFVLEAVSVIVQVISFKVWRKRVFLMAPIHHHFELRGWKETKITVRFWIISFILSLLTLLMLKVR